MRHEASAFQPTDAVAELSAYGGSAQTPLYLPHRERVAKLDWNESVHPPSDRVRQALADFALRGEVNWYPDVEAVALRTKLAEYSGAGFASIRVFGGSDAALEYAARTFIARGDRVVWCPPTYDNFRVYIQSCGGTMLSACLSSIWGPDLEGIMQSITPHTRIVYLVNPNNPTGTLYSPDQIISLLRAHPGVGFILDEAYYEYSGVTVAPLVSEYTNLMVVRSFSKAFGLAGLRVGYMLSHPENLQWMDRIRVGKNVSVLGQVAAMAALSDLEYIRDAVVRVRQAMTDVSGFLASLGLEVRPTPANFLMVKVHDPDAIVQLLADRLIFVRNRSRIPGLEGYIRITLGGLRTIDRLIEAFSSIPPRFLRGRPESIGVRMSRPPEHEPVTRDCIPVRADDGPGPASAGSACGSRSNLSTAVVARSRSS